MTASILRLRLVQAMVILVALLSAFGCEEQRHQGDAQPLLHKHCEATSSSTSCEKESLG